MYKTMHLLRKIPPEIINHHIIPYIPFANLTAKVLSLEKRKIFLVNMIRNVLYIDNIRLTRDIRKNYKGGKTYIFEGNHLFVYVKLTPSGTRIIDYFSISF